MRDLLDRFHVLLLTLGAVAAAASVYRVTILGWNLGSVAAIPFFLGLLIVLLLRRRLPVWVAVGLLVGMATIRGAVGLLTAGPDATTFVILVTASAVTGAVFGIRIGTVFLAGVSAMTVVIATLVCTGFVTVVNSTDPLVTQPQTWAYHVAGLATYAAVILIVEWSLQGHLASSLEEASVQARQLRESEERYRLLADNMRDVLFLMNMKPEMIYASPSVERLFGYTPEEFAGLPMYEVLAPASVDKARESFARYLELAEQGPVDVPPSEFEYRRKDGSTFWGEARPVFLRDEEGRLTGIQGLVRDVSERTQLEQKRAELEAELRQTEKMRAIGELAGGIAHDFNNQLTPIMARADLLAKGFVDEGSVREHARKILGPARNAADLTAKLLAFARKKTHEFRPVDLREVINEVSEILARGIDRRISVSQHFDAVPAVVEGDRSELENVLLNLGLNARDAMPDGGELVFGIQSVREGGDETASEGRYLKVTVSDTGCGMDEEVMQRAFEPFFTTKPLGKGTGMGLSAAYGTVASHGGRMEIDSVPGQGTVVTLLLPFSTVAMGPKVDTLAERLMAGATRALVIDDESAVREALIGLLETLGCSASGFGLAGDGIEFYRQNWNNVDVVLLDLVLPDKNGREVLAELKTINPEARVLLISGYTADEGIRELLREDTVEFLEKPFLLADLAESLTRLSGSR